MPSVVIRLDAIRFRTPTHPVRALLLVAAIVISYALAGCGAAEPDVPPLTTPIEVSSAPDASPTHVVEIPVRSDAPTSEAEAIYFASLAIDAFYLVEADVFNEHPEDPSKLIDVASEEIALAFAEAAATQADGGFTRTGGSTFVRDHSRTIVSDAQSRGGSSSLDWTFVDFEGCLVPQELTYTDERGNSMSVASATPYWLAVEFSPEASAWIVVGMITEPIGGVEC